MPAGGMPSGVVEGVDPVRHEYPALRSLEQILEASAQNAADEWTYPQRELTGEIYPAEAWHHKTRRKHPATNLPSKMGETCEGRRYTNARMYS